MEVAPLLIVAPRLPPRACGIGTYAWQLNQHWPRDGAANQFLVFADAAASREHLRTERIREFPAEARGFAGVLEQSGAADVLLHYAGRAYHRFGFPRWMPRAFAAWRNRDASRRLHVMFHELPADLPLFSKQGILQRLSFPVARALAEQAATTITNSAHHAAVLNRWKLRSEVRWMPVPSNIPAPAERTEQPQDGEFVIFGLPYTRLQTLREFSDAIRSWSESRRLTRLHLVGPRDFKFSPQADALLAEMLPRDVVVEHGELEPAQVSRAFHGAEFCLSSSNELTWSKSGTFMAYAAHGCAVVAPRSFSAEPLAFTIAREDVTAITAHAAEAKGEQLRRWYGENAQWESIANRVAAIVQRK
ncbi:MAG: hypothetical protein ABR526_12025 [Chthoniobacterales bacterium]